MEKTYTIQTPEGDIKLSTGKIATLSSGAVMVQQGGLVILATADIDTKPVEKDFFPLTVEYLERYYATGVMSGSRFNKREGFPSNHATIIARQIDHSIRPLFPKSFAQPVNVILTVLADDGHTNPEQLTVLAASAAIGISGVPFAGPASSVVVVVNQDGSVVVNPAHKEDAEYLGEFVVSGVTGRILNIEGWGKELSDEIMDQVLDAALERIAMLNAEQHKFSEMASKPLLDYTPVGVNQDLADRIYSEDRAAIEAYWYVADKKERDQKKQTELNESLIAKYVAEGSEFTTGEVLGAIDYVSKKIMRDNILKQDRRFSARKMDEIRPLLAEIDVLPQVHGSALFSRGYTQSLSIVTLGSTAKGRGFNDMQDEDTNESFMHHYNFPPFSTGEAGRVRYKPGRREVGHGHIGFNALRNAIANQEDFPYAVRVVSEIMTSNGSTSMAATCASSMALMAAGVPMKAAVGGIGVGLIAADESQTDYRLLLDIEGVEDFYGDMDFKVTGTTKGMTAIQFETKLQGVRPEIMKEAFRLSNKGRQQVLSVMNAAIAESRTELAPNAPRVEILMIPVDKIGEVIGPGGKVIKGMIAHASTLAEGQPEMDIDDSGRVTITANSKEQRDFLVNQVDMIANGPKLNEIYTGPVVRITEFGAFIELVPGLDGLLHISEISNERIREVTDVLQMGQIVKVKLIDKKPGRYSLSMKGVAQD